jgi:hypothetical protein
MKQNILLFIFIGFYLSFTQIVNAQGIIKDDFLVNDDTSNASQTNSSISMNAAGNFVIVWEDYRNNNNGDIYFQRYNSTGLPLETNIQVINDVDTAGQWHPSVAMDVTGDFVIVWDDNRNDDLDIFFQRYTSAGTTLGTNTKINNTVIGTDQYAPLIAMDEVGDFVIVWLIKYQTFTYDIYFQRYTSNGLPLGVNTKVNEQAGLASYTSFSIDASGNFVVVWSDSRNGNLDIYFQRYASDGTPLGINTKVNDDTGNNFQSQPSIAMDAVGDFVIVWYDYRNAKEDIYFQRYTSNGTPLGVNTKVNDDIRIAFRRVPSISINAAGDFIIVWQESNYVQGTHYIFAQKYFPSGNPDGSNYRIVSNAPNHGTELPKVITNNSDILFSWQDNRGSQGWDIYAKVVDWNWNGVTDISDELNSNPTEFSLSQNYPNPFNPSTKISWQVPFGSHQTIKLFDVLGREIETIVEGYYDAGNHSTLYIVNSTLPSGVYFYQLKAGDFVQTKKMMYLK